MKHIYMYKRALYEFGKEEFHVRDALVGYSSFQLTTIPEDTEMLLRRPNHSTNELPPFPFPGTVTIHDLLLQFLISLPHCIGIFIDLIQ